MAVGTEESPDSPRRRAEIILEWAKVHLRHPCGQNDQEREFMRKQHLNTVNQAVQEPGISEAYSREEAGLLRGLGVDIGGKDKEPSEKP